MGAERKYCLHIVLVGIGCSVYVMHPALSASYAYHYGVPNCPIAHRKRRHMQILIYTKIIMAKNYESLLWIYF